MCIECHFSQLSNIKLGANLNICTNLCMIKSVKKKKFDLTFKRIHKNQCLEKGTQI